MELQNLTGKCNISSMKEMPAWRFNFLHWSISILGESSLPCCRDSPSTGMLMETAASTHSSPLLLMSDLFKVELFAGNIIQKEKIDAHGSEAMELIYLQTASKRFTLPLSCMYINPSSITALAYTSDAELVLVTFPNKIVWCCFVEYEWLRKLITSGESH